MRWSPTLFRWHRWLGYLVALQVLAWMVGGLTLSALAIRRNVRKRSAASQSSRHPA